MIRDSGVDMIINLTAGMGGDWVPGEKDPSLPGPGTDMIGPEERLAHVVECKPDICSLDCGTMNFGGDYTHINTERSASSWSSSRVLSGPSPSKTNSSMSRRITLKSCS